MNRICRKPKLKLADDETEASAMAHLLINGCITLGDLNQESGKRQTTSKG